MPSTDATVFPVWGQAFQFVDVIKSSATGNPLTGGLEDLELLISKDGGDLEAAAGAVAELLDESGWVTVDLDPEDMEASVLAYQITAGNENAVYATGEIKTCDLAELDGRADAAEVQKLEQYLLQMWSQLFNRHTVNRETGVYTVYQADDATASVAGAVSDDGTLGTRGKLS